MLIANNKSWGSEIICPNGPVLVALDLWVILYSTHCEGTVCDEAPAPDHSILGREALTPGKKVSLRSSANSATRMRVRRVRRLR
jgi:hypothetical protein